jgi:hypothetical protein
MNHVCQHVPLDTACDDGSFCDGAERCDVTAGCVPGTAPDCNDNVACTTDVCDEATKSCKHIPNNALCSDGFVCNGEEICDAMAGCIAGTPLNCDDGLSCTVDTCSESAGGCVHTPNNAVCNDGLVCNGTETCSVLGPAPSGCISGTPVACPSDGIACTDDVCTEPTGACVHNANNANCPTGQFCVVAHGGCTAGTPCTNSAQCQDNDLCNGVESCSNGICVPGTPVNCDDGIFCTLDTCNPATGQCSHTASDALCDDGLACNGKETCNATTGCVAGTPVDCTGSVPCMQGVCIEPNGTCLFTPNDQMCSDGKFCDGVEKCTPTGCVAGTPVTCPSDGVSCTADVCDPTVDACVHQPQNSLCPCGQTCDPTLGCGHYCHVATCQGHVYQCGDCLDNDGDCKIDSDDPDCLGPCDNTEDSLYPNIPGQNNAPCKEDCYFDQDTGAGNDDCYWDHSCDPNEVSPFYYPEGSKCQYDPNAQISGTSLTCTTAFQMQSAQCLSYCGPLTPHGCDCFGCCVIPGAPTPVWLGSLDASGNGSCTLGNVGDPTKCHPCEQVQACLNPCGHCDICIGKPTLPPDCTVQPCPGNHPACGQPGQPICAAGSSCISGCCEANPT